MRTNDWEDRGCAVCGGPFRVPAWSRQRTCCREHSKAWRRRRIREYVAAYRARMEA